MRIVPILREWGVFGLGWALIIVRIFLDVLGLATVSDDIFTLFDRIAALSALILFNWLDWILLAFAIGATVHVFAKTKRTKLLSIWGTAGCILALVASWALIPNGSADAEFRPSEAEDILAFRCRLEALEAIAAEQMEIEQRALDAFYLGCLAGLDVGEESR